ncbi:hypothetical protein D9M72_613590 [compost metagenome]
MNTAWLMMIECSPRPTLSRLKKLSSAIASTMSGMIIGAISKVSTTWPLWLSLRRNSMPNARNVPSTQAMKVADNATTRVLSAADRIAVLCASAAYHFSDTPPQAVGKPDLLNDSRINTRIGI